MCITWPQPCPKLGHRNRNSYIVLFAHISSDPYLCEQQTGYVSGIASMKATTSETGSLLPLLGGTPWHTGAFSIKRRRQQQQRKRVRAGLRRSSTRCTPRCALRWHTRAPAQGHTHATSSSTPRFRLGPVRDTIETAGPPCS